MFARILFGTDFTTASREVENAVVELAARLGSSVVVLHAIEPIDPGGDQRPYESFYGSLVSTASGKMQEVAQRLEARSIPCETRVTIGARWKEIVETAHKSDAELIVLGSRPIGELSPGTTSHKVFWASQVPVLFIRHGLQPVLRVWR